MDGKDVMVCGSQGLSQGGRDVFVREDPGHLARAKRLYRLALHDPGGEVHGRQNTLARKVRIRAEDRVHGHSRSHALKDKGDRDPRSANHWLPAQHSWLADNQIAHLKPILSGVRGRNNRGQDLRSSPDRADDSPFTRRS